MRRIIADSVGNSTGADDPAPGHVDHQVINGGLHLAQLRGDPLPQADVVPQVLRLDTAHQPLHLIHESVELGVRTDVQVAEAVEKLHQIGDGAVPELSAPQDYVQSPWAP
jgi:hypothetical protein